MLGLILNVVEEVIVDLFDEDAWDDVIENAGVSGAYTAVGYYDDADVWAIIGAVGVLLGLDGSETLRVAGRHMLPRLATRIPKTVERFTTASDFLTSINSIIHPDVELSYPHPVPPVLGFEEDEGCILVRYRSHRGFSYLAEGFIFGCADLFGEEVGLNVVAGSVATDAQFRVQFSTPRAQELPKGGTG